MIGLLAYKTSCLKNINFFLSAKTIQENHVNMTLKDSQTNQLYLNNNKKKNAIM